MLDSFFWANMDYFIHQSSYAPDAIHQQAILDAQMACQDYVNERTLTLIPEEQARLDNNLEVAMRRAFRLLDLFGFYRQNQRSKTVLTQIDQIEERCYQLFQQTNNIEQIKALFLEVQCIILRENGGEIDITPLDIKKLPSSINSESSLETIFRTMRQSVCVDLARLQEIELQHFEHEILLKHDINCRVNLRYISRKNKRKIAKILLKQIQYAERHGFETSDESTIIDSLSNLTTNEMLAEQLHQIAQDRAVRLSPEKMKQYLDWIVRYGDEDTRSQLTRLSWFYQQKSGEQNDGHINIILNEIKSWLSPAKKSTWCSFCKKYQLDITKQQNIFLIYLNEEIRCHEQNVQYTEIKEFDNLYNFSNAVCAPARYLLRIEHYFRELFHDLSTKKVKGLLGVFFKKTNRMIDVLHLNALKEYERIMLREIARYEVQIIQFQRWARANVDSPEMTIAYHKMLHKVLMIRGNFLQERLNKMRSQNYLKLKDEILVQQERLMNAQTHMQSYIYSDYFKLREALKRAESLDEKKRLSEASIQCSIEFFAEGHVLGGAEHQRLCRLLLLKDESAQSQYRMEKASFHEKILKQVEEYLNILVAKSEEDESIEHYLLQACYYFLRLGDVVVLEHFRQLVDQQAEGINTIIHTLKEKLGPSKQELVVLIENRLKLLASHIKEAASKLNEMTQSLMPSQRETIQEIIRHMIFVQYTDMEEMDAAHPLIKNWAEYILPILEGCNRGGCVIHQIQQLVKLNLDQQQASQIQTELSQSRYLSPEKAKNIKQGGLKILGDDMVHPNMKFQSFSSPQTMYPAIT